MTSVDASGLSSMHAMQMLNIYLALACRNTLESYIESKFNHIISKFIEIVAIACKHNTNCTD